MMDKIFLNEMRVETIVGIWDWERKTKQIVSIDLEMGADIKKAAMTDNIEDTLNSELRQIHYNTQLNHLD